MDLPERNLFSTTEDLIDKVVEDIGEEYRAYIRDICIATVKHTRQLMKDPDILQIKFGTLGMFYFSLALGTRGIRKNGIYKKQLLGKTQPTTWKVRAAKIREIDPNKGTKGIFIHKKMPLIYHLRRACVRKFKLEPMTPIRKIYKLLEENQLKEFNR